MIAQRKPNNDKGFEDFAREMRVFWRLQTFLGCPPRQIPSTAAFFPPHALRRANAACAQTLAWQAFAAMRSGFATRFFELRWLLVSPSPLASRSS
ncbi:hypothetical protein [Paraburkholderia sp. JHI869]|uniref:hypothetical protein n=1 Tax=Paraburkholderia sp. JHI869 TaxID=3112959 RepID=UPI00319DEFB7